MHTNHASHASLPALLATQLMAAEVYSRFLHLSSEGERDLWKRLLLAELDHVNYLRLLLLEGPPDNAVLPEANLERMQDICGQILENGADFFLLRLEGALRLECAELDYGLEGVAARRLRGSGQPFDYPGDVASHIHELLAEASRYAESRNIGLQIIRLQELLETSLSDTIALTKVNFDGIPHGKS